MAGSVIDSLFVRLGFKVEPEGLQSFAKNLEGVKHMAEAVFSFEIIKRIGEFVESSIGAAAHTNDMAEAFDLSATKLDAMGRVAVANSVSVDAMSEAYRGVSSMAGQAALGIGRGAMMFKKLGLHAKDATGQAKSGVEVMGDIADKMTKLSTTERLAMAGRLGIDPLLAKKMADMGRAGFMKQVSEAEGKGILSDRDFEMADETEIAFNKLHGTVKSFVALVAIQLGPTVKQAVKAFTDWVGTNRDLIKQNTREYFETVRGVLSKVVDVVKEVAKHGTLLKIVLGLIVANKMGTTVAGWLGPLGKLATNLLTGAGASEALALGLAAVKTVAVGGLLAALGLVIEDLWTFYQGGDSVTGWLLERFPYAVEVAKGAIAVLSGAIVALVAGSGPLGLLVVGIGGLVIAAQSVMDAWNPLKQWFGELWDSIATPFVNLGKWIGQTVADLFAPALEPLKIVWGFIADKIAWLADKVGPLLRPIGDLVLKWVLGPIKDALGVLSSVWDKVEEAAKYLGFGQAKTPEKYLGDNPEEEFAKSNSAFNNRTNKGLGMLDGGGNMLNWGPGVAAAGAAAGGGTVNVNSSVGPTTINVSGAGDPQKVAAEVMRQQERRAQLARQAARDAQAGHR